SYGPEDHLGSTRMVLDEDGTVKEALMYQPYGAVSDVQGISGSRTDPLRQKFTTKEFDEEGDENGAPGIQAYHFGFRVYDPDVGVWMSTDPADQYWNTYSYCGADPVNFTDPDGAFTTAGAVAMMAGAAAGFYLGGVAGNGGQLNPGKWTNYNAAAAGFIAGTAIGAGIGWGIESGAFSSFFAANSGSILSGVGAAGNVGYAARQLGKIAVESGNNNETLLAQGGPRMQQLNPGCPAPVVSDAAFGEYFTNSAVINWKRIGLTLWDGTPLAFFTDASARSDFLNWLGSDDASYSLAMLFPMGKLASASPRLLMGRQISIEMTKRKIARMAAAMKAGTFDWKASGPIVVAMRDGLTIVIDGHHRAAAAIKAGLSKVPITVKHVTDLEWEKLLMEALEAAGR
ncbi:MAG: ParB N-terminal domain-containing protein, partial [Chitinispirillaceae bacterium]|nr:ParB N-terminal domain-containing protein [Chitinispirillaceae bacterium]